MPSTPLTPPLDAATSADLLARARRGDRSALGRLLERYLPDLRRWTHRRLPRWLRGTHDTADLLHDAIARTYTRLDRFQPQGRRALAAYLRRAVENRIADEHRRAARWQTDNAALDGLTAPSPSPLDATIAAERHRRYRAALARLEPRDQQLIVAHLELDYSHAQLGCMIGRSPNAARMALCRAIDRLAARMRER